MQTLCISSKAFSCCISISILFLREELTMIAAVFLFLLWYQVSYHLISRVSSLGIFVPRDWESWSKIAVPSRHPCPQGIHRDWALLRKVISQQPMDGFCDTVFQYLCRYVRLLYQQVGVRIYIIKLDRLSRLSLGNPSLNPLSLGIVPKDQGTGSGRNPTNQGVH